MSIHSIFLRYFDEVCRSGSIRLAARQLYVASSAVNRQILKVEDELGVKLFERHRGGMRPTAAGRLLHQHIKRTLEDAERTISEIAALEEGARPQVVLVGQESVIAYFLPPALMELHSVNSDISTTFRASSGTKLQAQLLAGKADIALAFDPPNSPDILVYDSCEMPVGAVVNAGHPLHERSSVSLADCAPYPMVLPDRTWPLRARLDELIARCGLALNIITSSNSMELLKTMVEQHQAIGFQALVGIERELQSGELLHIPLHSPEPMLQRFCLIARSDRASDPVIRQVLELTSKRLDSYRRGSA